MTDHKRHGTITPAPVDRDQPATIRDAMELDQQHAEECTAERRAECEKRDRERADKDGAFWNRIIAAEKALESIRGSMTFLKWAVPIIVTLLGTVGVFVAKYAIVGAITLELDKRIPPGAHINVEQTSSLPHYATYGDPR